VQNPVSRSPSAAIQRQGDNPSNNIRSLDEMLDRFNVPEEDVISLFSRLSPDEKNIVLNPARGYKAKTASALNTEEMIRAVNHLNPPLATKLEWVHAAAGSASSIDYAEIRPMILAAPQEQRTGLRNTHRSFFVDVCDNNSMRLAVADLDFDLPAQLNWIWAEMTSVRMELDYAQIRNLITSAEQYERDALKNNTWRGFFVDVCTNETMLQAVQDLQFDLASKLDWIREELISVRIELSYDQISAMIRSASQPERDALKNNTWRDFFVQVCTNETMLQAVTDLGWELRTKLEWLIAEGNDIEDNIYDTLSGQDEAIRNDVKNSTIIINYLRSNLHPMGYWKVQLLLKYGTEESFPGLVRTVFNLLLGPNVTELRREIGNMTQADIDALKVEVGLYDALRTVLSEADSSFIIRMLEQGLLAEQTGVSWDMSETLLVGDPTAAFTERKFEWSTGFDVAYYRDRLQVTVRINLRPTDDTARTQMATVQSTWESNIETAWKNFNLTNGAANLPLRFDCVFTASNPHHEVDVHPGIPSGWPGVDMTNWYTGRLVSPNHEFGHMLGNPDEYFVSQAHYTAITGEDPTAAAPGTVVSETDTAGKTRYANQTGIMGVSSQPVQPRHLDYFVRWINDHRRRNADNTFAEPEYRLGP
jgi:hypothetical protein